MSFNQNLNILKSKVNIVDAISNLKNYVTIFEDIDDQE
jgi:hypothetical protein